jgi:regulator of sirC expression with transglutaminase-like and TPR domain
MTKHPAEMPPPCRLAFTHLVRRPEAAIDLGEAALLIAKEEYPDLEVTEYLARLDGMAADIRSAAGPSPDPRRLVDELGGYLFRSQGFRGNVEEYYDPRNSFLNEVMDRRLGIPITLSAIYLQVGRRIGLNVHGVGMPGHFLVKVVESSTEIIIDPFNGGSVLSPDDCQRILDRLYDGKLCFEPEMLATVGTRQILTRMLANLKGIYYNNQEYGKVLSVVERLLIVHPNSAGEIRDRGLLLYQLKRHAEASADLDRYLRLAPDAEDSEVIREHLRTLRQRAVALN